jgi:hypothetical protein
MQARGGSLDSTHLLVRLPWPVREGLYVGNIAAFSNFLGAEYGALGVAFGDDPPVADAVMSADGLLPLAIMYEYFVR